MKKHSTIINSKITKKEKSMTLNSFDRLGVDQKAYIEAKVKELGSLEAVKKFYSKPCLVTRYALSVAKKEGLK